MKFSNVLPLAAVGTAFVLPAEQVLSELSIEDHHQDRAWYNDVSDTKDTVVSSLKGYFDQATEAAEVAWEQVSASTKNVWDEAFDYASNTALGNNVQSWMDADWFDEQDGSPHHGPPHHGPPHHRKPGHGRRPHHPPHHCKPNLTIWQLISESKYTTTLAKLVSEYDDLVETLNSTKANYTLFAPTDAAFEKIPKKAPKPSKEHLKAILQYHVVDGFYPAGRVFATHTAPTLLESKHLSSKPEPQRVTFKLTLRGLTVNFFSRIVAVNIFGTNGVIHGVDWLIQPPPKVVDIVGLFPGEFSTLELGLAKTGLLEQLNNTKHAGGTFFAPSNFAFKKLGPKINAFLFSKYGEKYLIALLEYHVVPKHTLYSDALYKAESSDSELSKTGKGLFHIDLPTLLKDRNLSVDIARWGAWITIKINGFSSVGVQDVVAKDGVIHVVRSVLIPPKKLANGEDMEDEEEEEEELTVEDLVERLDPYVNAKNDL